MGMISAFRRCCAIPGLRRKGNKITLKQRGHGRDIPWPLLFERGLFDGPPDALQGVEECDELALLPGGKVHLEALVVEVDQLIEVGCCAVVEVGGASGQSA